MEGARHAGDRPIGLPEDALELLTEARSSGGLRKRAGKGGDSLAVAVPAEGMVTTPTATPAATSVYTATVGALPAWVTAAFTAAAASLPGGDGGFSRFRIRPRAPSSSNGEEGGGGVAVQPSTPAPFAAHRDGGNGEDGTTTTIIAEEVAATGMRGRVLRYLSRGLSSVQHEQVVWLAKDLDALYIDRAIAYVKANEVGRQLTVVHFVDDTAAVRGVVAAMAEASLKSGGNSVSSTIHSTTTTGEALAGRGGGGPPSMPAAQADEGPGSGGGGGPTLADCASTETTVVAAASTADAPAAASSPPPPPHPVMPSDRMLLQPPQTESPEAGELDHHSDGVDAETLRLLPSGAPEVRRLPDVCVLLNALHPELRINSLVVRGSHFSPASVAWLSTHVGVRPNMMLMRTPKLDFPFQVSVCELLFCVVV